MGRDCGFVASDYRAIGSKVWRVVVDRNGNGDGVASEQTRVSQLKETGLTVWAGHSINTWVLFSLR